MVNFGKLFRSFEVPRAAIDNFHPKNWPAHFKSTQAAQQEFGRRWNNFLRFFQDNEGLMEELAGPENTEMLRPAPIMGSKGAVNNPVTRFFAPITNLLESDSSKMRELAADTLDINGYTVGNMLGIPNRPDHPVELYVEKQHEELMFQVGREHRDAYARLSVRRAGKRQEKLGQFMRLKQSVEDSIKARATEGADVFPENLVGEQRAKHGDDLLFNGIPDELIIRQRDFDELVDRATYHTPAEISGIKDPDIRASAQKLKNQYLMFYDELARRGLIFDITKADTEEIEKFIRDDLGIVPRSEDHMKELVQEQLEKAKEIKERYVPRRYIQSVVEAGEGVLKERLFNYWWPQKKPTKLAEETDEAFQSRIKEAEDKLKNQVQDTIDRILHDPLAIESRLNGKNSPGYLGRDRKMPRELHARRVEVPDELIWEFIGHNPMVKHALYTRSVLPEIHLYDKFNDRGGVNQVLRDIQQEQRERIDQIPKDSREHRIASRKMRREFELYDDLLDRVRGINTKHANPNSAFNRIKTALLKYNALKFMGQVPVASLSDFGINTLVWGMEPFQETLALTAKNLDRFKGTARQMQEIGIGADLITGSRLAHMTGVDTYREIGGQGIINALEQNLDWIHGKFGDITLMNQYQTFAKNFSGILIQHEIIKDALKVAKGQKLPTARRNTLAQLNITNNDLKRIAKEFNEHGETVDNVFNIARSDRWTDEKLARKFDLSLFKAVDQVVVARRAGNMPILSDTPAGEIILQFRTFSFNAGETVLKANLQNANKNFLAGLTAMTFFGLVSYMTKQAINGYDVPWDKPREILLNAVDRSGIHGYLFDANMILERLTAGNLGINPLLGGTELSRYAQRDVVGSIFGPSVQTVEDIFYSVQAGTNFITGQPVEGYQSHAAMKSMPLSNLWYTRALLQAGRTAAGLDND